MKEEFNKKVKGFEEIMTKWQQKDEQIVKKDMQESEARKKKEEQKLTEKQDQAIKQEQEAKKSENSIKVAPKIKSEEEFEAEDKQFEDAKSKISNDKRDAAVAK